MKHDKDHISALWDNITPKLFGYLVHTLRDKNIAEDVLQTTWVKAIENLSKYQEQGAGFSAWIFAIARNECKQYWRTLGREVPFDPLLHDTERTDLKGEYKIMVDQVLVHLSPADRELIRLRYIADLPLHDIARILKINPIALRVKMHRVISSMRSILKSQSTL